MSIDDTIRGAKSGTVEPDELFRALADATLILAIASAEANSVQPLIVAADGVDHGAVFTAQEHMVGVPDGSNYVEVTGRDLAANWPDALKIALNPGTDELTLVLDPDAVRRVAAVPEQDTLAAGQQVTIGAPTPPPAPELVEAVQEGVRATPEVIAAYLFQLVDATGASRLMAGAVVTKDADDQAVMAAFVQAVAAGHTPGGDVDFIALGPDLLPIVQEYAERLS